MNIEQILYTKPRLVKGVLIAVGILIIFISFQNTLSLFWEYTDLKKNIASISFSAPTQHKYPHEAFEEIDLNKIVFESISAAAGKYDVTVKTITPPVSVSAAEYLLLTEEVVLEGHFVNLLRCIDEADITLSWIKIASMKFERTDAKSNSLVLKVYFQVIKTVENDK